MGIGLGFLLPVAAIIATIILMVMTDAAIGVKVAAVVVCLGTLILPRVFPSGWYLGGPIQAALSIAIVVYLKSER